MSSSNYTSVKLEKFLNWPIFIYVTLSFFFSWAVNEISNKVRKDENGLKITMMDTLTQTIIPVISAYLCFVLLYLAYYNYIKQLIYWSP